MKLEGKVALIVGAGTKGVTGNKPGNGRAAALLLAQEGARIVAADISLQAAEETVAMIREAGGDAIAIQGDVSKETDAERMIEETIARYGKLDILDNNVGIYLQKDIIDMCEEEWDRIMAVNVKGIFLVSKYAIRVMLKRNSGTIINISSVNGVQHRAGTSVYDTSKAAVIAFTKSMALECAPYGIRVNCVVPAAIDTPLFNSVSTPEGRNKRMAGIPLRRFGEAGDVAKAVLFFASDDSAYITGEALLVDGGLMAGIPKFD